MARKYVLASRGDGASDIVVDSEVQEASVVDLWLNDTVPARLGAAPDPTAQRDFLHEPPDGGAIFRVVTFTKELNDMTPEQALEMHKALNSVHVPTIEELRAAKHPTMHRTDSLNYFVLLSGRLWMLSEGRDVLLEPGDYAIQLGGMHAWRVAGDEPALLACVLIDGMPG